MKVLERFSLNPSYDIEIALPIEEKFNYYFCDETEGLGVFDEMSIVFAHQKNKFLLSEDMASMNLTLFRNSLKKALHNTQVISNTFMTGQLGYYYNLYTMKENSADFCSLPSSMWSGKNVETWLYNKDNKIYLEISPSYPWLYSDLDEAKQDKSFVPFDEFMKTYKPIFVHEISQDVARQWIYQCDAILNSMVKCEHREE